MWYFYILTKESIIKLLSHKEVIKNMQPKYVKKTYYRDVLGEYILSIVMRLYIFEFHDADGIASFEIF